MENKKDYFDRILEEHEQLSFRIERLQASFSKPHFLTFSEEKQFLLLAQFNVMQAYEKILFRRIMLGRDEKPKSETHNICVMGKLIKQNDKTILEINIADRFDLQLAVKIDNKIECLKLIDTDKEKCNMYFEVLSEISDKKKFQDKLSEIIKNYFEFPNE